MTSTDTLILGAGLSGLVLANELKGKCLILEKSRGVGGRIATRRIEGLGLDHGALYLKNAESLRAYLENLKFPFKNNSQGIYFPGGMTSLAKELSQELIIRKETRAVFISKITEGWKVETEEKLEFIGKTLVLTCPLPQSLELLDKSHISYKKELKNITYDKALLALIVSDQFTLPDVLDPRLHSITPMGPRDLHPTGYVVRGSPDFCETQFDADDDTNLKLLIEGFKSSFKAPPQMRSAELKKWRYVVPHFSLPHSFEEVDQGLFLIGDSFLAPDASGAIQSALALAAKLA